MSGRKNSQKLPSLDPCDDCSEHICGKCVKRDRLEEERDELLQGLEKLGWPCQLKDLAKYAAKLSEGIGNTAQALDTILCLYNDSKVPGDLWTRNEYRQGIRDALEALKRHGVIKDYDLRGKG